MFSVNSRSLAVAERGFRFNKWRNTTCQISFNVYDVSQVSSRVERRLQDIEDEMRSGRQVLSERHHREKAKHLSGELQEVK